jgi:hypothetical protein
MGAALSSTAMAAMSFKSAITAWKNTDLSFGEKLTTMLMSLGMVIPSVIGMINNFGKAIGLTNIMQGVSVALTAKMAKNTDLLTGKMTAEQIVQKTGMTLD